MERLENLQLQLDEYEMLTSMYPDDGDVVWDDVLHFSQLKTFVETEGNIDELSYSKITLKIRLKIDKFVLILTAQLTASYPLHQLPDVFIRSNDLNRVEEQKINENLASFVAKELLVGDLCLSQICQWITEEGESYCIRSKETSSSQTKSSTTAEDKRKDTPDVFSRFWIFSHHIYSKTKRKMILEWSKELKLTGFSMPGKPGVICAEGLQENCEEYWKRLRNMNWKRIQLIDRFDKTIEEKEENIDQYRKFLGEEFKEKDFAVHGGRDYHMDLGMFFRFLQGYDLHGVFPLLFGVEGKNATKQ